jgi:hypothetical protein
LSSIAASRQGWPDRIDRTHNRATVQYEFAIYMMEHNDIDDVSVTLIPDKSVRISGRVDLFGEAHDFVINWY